MDLLKNFDKVGSQPQSMSGKEMANKVLGYRCLKGMMFVCLDFGL